MKNSIYIKHVVKISINTMYRVNSDLFEGLPRRHILLPQMFPC